MEQNIHGSGQTVQQRHYSKVGIPLSFKEALDNAKGSSLALIPYEKETGIKLKKCFQAAPQ